MGEAAGNGGKHVRKVLNGEDPEGPLNELDRRLLAEGATLALNGDAQGPR